MKDKVQLIKEDIESYKESMKGLEPHSDFRKGQLTAYNQILQFIDSIPEESKKQPKFKIGDTIKGPCNNIFQVKEVLGTQYLLHSENGDELNSIEIVDKYSCISEESTSKDLEEAAKHYLYGAVLYNDVYVGNPTEEDCIRCFKAGAEWQKQQMMKDAVETTIVNDWQYGKDQDHAVIPAIHQRIKGYNVGDRVKIIIVKTEQQ